MKGEKHHADFLKRAWARLRRDRAAQRQGLLLAAFCCALLLEIWAICIDFPEHRSLVKHVFVSIGVLLLPFTMIGIVCRLRLMEEKIKRIYVVRPFKTLSSKPEQDGKTIALLLSRRLALGASNVAAKQGGERPDVTFEVGGAKFSLEWLWSKLRPLLTGKKDIIIDGILVDLPDALELRVWDEDLSVVWLGYLDRETFCQSMDKAIRAIAFCIFERLEPELLAEIRNGEWNFEEAVRIMSATNRWQNVSLSLRTAQMCLEGEYLHAAEQQLGQLKTNPRLEDEDRFTLVSLEADLRFKRGEFYAGRKLLETVLKEPKCKPERKVSLRSSLGDSWMFETRLETAVDVFDEAATEAWEEICRLAEIKEFTELKYRLLEEQQKFKVINLLSQLFDIVRQRARAKRMQSSDSLEDLEWAVDIVQTIRLISPGTASESDYLEALSRYDLAVYYYEGLSTISEASEDEAYGEKRRRCESENGFANYLFEKGIQSSNDDDDDYFEIVNQAWRCYRKTTCCLLTRRLMRDQIADEILQAAVVRLTEIFAKLKESTQARLRRMLTKTQELSKELDSHYVFSLQRLTLSYLEAALAEFTDEALESLFYDLERFPTVSLPEAPGESDSGSLKLSEEGRKRWEETGFDSDDCLSLSVRVGWLLHTVASARDQDGVDQLSSRINIETDAIRALEYSKRLFNQLIASPPKRVRAEGKYGLACISAIVGDGAEEAAKYLREAGLQAGEGTFAYLNRARIDQDFASIRSDASFSAVFNEKAK